MGHYHPRLLESGGLRVLVTGANGQLGSAMVEALSQRANVLPFSRASLDITDSHALSAAVERERPHIILNCAAYNDVDGAEDDAAASLASNALGVLSLARAAASVQATLVHYSTDFVFDGKASQPYTEQDDPNPQSTYAASKLLGEWFAAETPVHYVLRVESLFGGSQPRSSVDRIIAALTRGSSARVFVDRTVTPSYVHDVVDATWALLTRKAPIGLYHCVNTGVTTWYQLAERIRALLSGAGELVPIRVSDVHMRARRPKYCALANSKLQGVGISMPHWEDALLRHLKSPGRLN